jgi:transposase InsO family protein
MYEALRQKAWWPNMDKDCLDFSKSCPICQARGTAQDRQFSRQPILNNPVAQVPFETVSIDVLSMTKSKTGMAYILVAVDHFSKWVEAEAYPSPPTAIQVNQFMLHHFYFRHGAPAVIMADNGSNLTANELNADLFRQWSSKIRNSTAYHPQANGLVERMNRPICDFLSTFCNQYEQADWDTFLDATIHAINTSVSAATGFTPYFLCHGREAFRVIDHRLPTISKFRNLSYQEYANRLQRVLIHANVVAHKNNDKSRSMYNQTRVIRQIIADEVLPSHKPNPRAFAPRDWVMIYQPTGLCRTAGLIHVRKVEKHWKGPFQIINQINTVTYNVLVNGTSVPINLTRLKPYYLRERFVQEPF